MNAPDRTTETARVSARRYEVHARDFFPGGFVQRHTLHGTLASGAAVSALADFLGENAFVMGAEPTEIDAAAYGQLANIMRAPIDTPVKDDALGRPNLVAYVDRVRQRFFP